MKLTKNKRGAGRKALPITHTNVKATVPNELVSRWNAIANKQKFVREAIAQKIKAESVEYVAYTPQSILICKIEIGSDSPSPCYYGQTESGAIFDGASAYPDNNGELCLMRLIPVLGDQEEALEAIASAGGFYVTKVWGTAAIESRLPTAEWYIEMVI